MVTRLTKTVDSRLRLCGHSYYKRIKGATKTTKLSFEVYDSCTFNISCYLSFPRTQLSAKMPRHQP